MNFTPFQEVYNTTLIKRGNLSFRVMLNRGYNANGLIDMNTNGITICLEDKSTNQKAILFDEHFKDEDYKDQLNEYLTILMLPDEAFYKVVNENPRCRMKIRMVQNDDDT